LNYKKSIPQDAGAMHPAECLYCQALSGDFFSYVLEGNPVAFASGQPEIAPAKAEFCWH
jgi:hypothetical protein